MVEIALLLDPAAELTGLDPEAVGEGDGDRRSNAFQNGSEMELRLSSELIFLHDLLLLFFVFRILMDIFP